MSRKETETASWWSMFRIYDSNTWILLIFLMVFQATFSALIRHLENKNGIISTDTPAEVLFHLIYIVYVISEFLENSETSIVSSRSYKVYLLDWKYKCLVCGSTTMYNYVRSLFFLVSLFYDESSKENRRSSFKSFE